MSRNERKKEKKEETKKSKEKKKSQKKTERSYCSRNPLEANDSKILKQIENKLKEISQVFLGAGPCYIITSTSGELVFPNVVPDDDDDDDDDDHGVGLRGRGVKTTATRKLKFNLFAKTKKAALSLGDSLGKDNQGLGILHVKGETMMFSCYPSGAKHLVVFYSDISKNGDLFDISAANQQVSAICEDIRQLMVENEISFAET